MLIAIDANEANLTGNRVGINRYAYQLLWSLYRMNLKDEFLIYLKSSPREDLPKERKNWKYRVIPFPKLWTQTRLPFDLLTHRPKPDILLCLTHYGPRFSPIPYVVSIMDLGFVKFPEQFTKKDLAQLNSWTKYSVKESTHIIAISKNTKKDIEKIYGIDPQKISVTYLSYDEDKFKENIDNSILEKYSLPQEYMLFLGSLKPSKNIPNIIKSLIYVRNKEIKLVISGKKGWMYDAIYKVVKDNNLQNRVIFTGFVDDADVSTLMSMSKCFVMPSIYEGFGIPILEAMACSTPVVVSNVGSIKEVAGDAAIYVDPNAPKSIASGIDKALGSKRNEYINNGHKRVKYFSWKECAKQTINILYKTAYEYRKQH